MSVWNINNPKCMRTTATLDSWHQDNRGSYLGSDGSRSQVSWWQLS